MPEATWYAGVCDTMLRKVQFWVTSWPNGEAYATRPWLSHQGEVREITTKRMVMVPWTQAEMQHLIRILEVVRPKWTMTADLKAAFRSWSRFRLLPGNQRVMPMISYQQDPGELLRVLLDVKAGNADLSLELAEQFKKSGDGPLWG